MNKKFGILMPVSSLPSAEGIGTLGRCAYKFVDFLHASGAGIWQVLPLNPTNYGDSPYQSCSANALNYYFIDLATLVEEGLLKAKEVESADLFGNDARRVDYGKQFKNKLALLRLAFTRFARDFEFEKFVEEGEYADFALFMALKERFGHRAFIEWDEKYRFYDGAVAEEFAAENGEEILFWQFTQYEFLRQWRALTDYAHGKGVLIMGDIPLYIAYDSAEMWKYGDELFLVDARRRPEFVAGCPPDGFSEDGQLWGNPVYDWQKMRAGGYKWWNKRIDDCFKLYDILRIDHFRGFDRYYSIPAGDKNARGGHWVDGPKEELFASRLDAAIVAEDLGVLDEGVLRLMKNVGYPGMKILMFAFDGSADNEHKPSNYTKNYVCYTGTHDNIPLKQYIADLDEEQSKVYADDLKRECVAAGVEFKGGSDGELCRTVMELAFASRADTVILPMWDILLMGGEARINLPATVSPLNWSWRFMPEEFTKETEKYLYGLAKASGRI